MSSVIDSASTILVRSWESSEVYLVLRSSTQRAFASTYVFPGGQIDEADGAAPVRAAASGVEPRVIVAAARELFEETGVLVAVSRDGTELAPTLLEPHRQALLTRQCDMAAVLGALGAVIDGSRLVPLGVKTTPPFALRRFRNQFCMAVLPPGQVPSVIVGELESGAWMSARDAVAAAEAGDLFLAPPVWMLLEAFADGSPGSVLERLRGFTDDAFEQSPLPIRFSPQIITVPGRTPTLPPATHTNAYLIGQDELILVDPATDDPTDQRKLMELLAQLDRSGRRLGAIVLTHHHPDHTGAVKVVQQATGAPLWAHPLTMEKLPGWTLDRALHDGDVVDLGPGGPIHILHTPGHAAGHICLWQPLFGGLVVGDMVSTLSTILIDPPEGDLAVYLASLDRLRSLPARIMYPSHGGPTTRVKALLSQYVEHRLWRVDKAARCLTDQPQTLDDLVTRVYDDVAVTTHPIAKRNLLASLIKLAADGRALETREGAWSRP